jgi:di/tricarboxylate transporter
MHVSAEVLSLVILVIMFVLATALPINMGTLGFTAVFLFGTIVLDLDVEGVLEQFPASIFLTLAGITFLFGIAQINGTVDLLVRGAIRLVGGRLAAIPWIMFAVTALLVGIGALFAVAIVAPIALRFAFKHRIDPLLMGMMVVHGALGGAFTPIRPGRPRGRRADLEEDSSDAEDTRVRYDQVATIVGLLAFAVCTVVYKLDVGFVSIVIGVVLSLIAPARAKGAVDKIAWSTVLLIVGVLTYVGVLEEAGTIDYISSAIAGLGMPLLAALLICYLGGVASAFASSVAILGVMIPLAIPFLQQGEIGAVGFIAALAIASTVVDVSPFSTNGALVLANAQDVDRDRFYKRLLSYATIVIVVGPLLAWAFVLPGGL